LWLIQNKERRARESKSQEKAEQEGKRKRDRQTVKENDLSDHFLRFSTNNWVLASLRE